jgi:hypothetical protein
LLLFIIFVLIIILYYCTLLSHQTHSQITNVASLQHCCHNFPHRSHLRNA